MNRRIITIRGIVQGVGFRPFVYRLAHRFHVRGSVGNDGGAVRIDAEARAAVLDDFVDALTVEAPPLARIYAIEQRFAEPMRVLGFFIESSGLGDPQSILISPDVAPCAECLAEMRDPRDRRYRYPFLNCTNCGPRLTIVTGAPYDRERTTMNGFAMCRECRAEYEDPTNRRFHAQPIACPHCGPQLKATDGGGRPFDTVDPLALFANALLDGQIGALKGLGGYYLVCDARNASAVELLRRRKHRDEKPFALVAATADSAGQYCRLSDHERALLESPQRPIVLLARLPVVSRDGAPCAEVAPGNQAFGVMLPSTPLHYLLMDAVGDVPLVMTSGNRSDEPTAYEDDDALGRLGDVADVFLRHNRPIQVRCDDSVVRVVDNISQPVRRSRGYAPEPLSLPIACHRPTLAVGGQLKGTFALGRDNAAVVSHHLGDLDHWSAYQAFERDLRLYEQLFQTSPDIIVHDMHPDYASTRYAQHRAERDGLERLAVQHHHAHMAACMAEHGLNEPVIGVSFDGTGWGERGSLLDGERFDDAFAVWGGEFLVGDYRQVRRAARLRYVPLPGGDRAIREPWRMAVAHLHDAGRDSAEFLPRIAERERRTIATLVERRRHAPPTSSVGRLFDAVAAAAGLRDRVSYEGQAAQQWEASATTAEPDYAYGFDLVTTVDAASWVLDTRPLIRDLADEVRRREPLNRIARRFHTTLAQMIVETCRRIRGATGVNVVVLSGGVFLNALLTHDAVAALTREGFRPYRHRLVPPNDGGLCLGQLAVAAALSSPHSTTDVRNHRAPSLLAPLQA